MRKKAETLFKEKVIIRLRTLKNIWFVKVQQVAVRGTPDILMCVSGHFVAWELKQKGGIREDALQRYNLDKIALCGGIAVVVSPENFEEEYEYIKSLGPHKSVLRP